MKEKMLQTNRQTLRKNDTSFSFRGQSSVHAKQCIGRAANQYYCLTYSAWVETLYTGIGRTAILFFPCNMRAATNSSLTISAFTCIMCDTRNTNAIRFVPYETFINIIEATAKSNACFSFFVQKLNQFYCIQDSVVAYY